VDWLTRAQYVCLLFYVIFPLENRFVLSACTQEVLLALLKLSELNIGDMRAVPVVSVVRFFFGGCGRVVIKLNCAEIVCCSDNGHIKVTIDRVDV
jgi:hypothetical protein